MKKTLLFLSTLACYFITETIFAQAPNCLWTRSAGGSSNEYTTCMTTDAFGNIYVAGRSGSDSIIFGPITLYNLGENFLVKYDGNGNALWAKKMGGSIYSIAVDALSNVYSTGAFRGTVDFDPGSGTYSLSTNFPNDPDVFISKMDAFGNFIWAKQFVGGGLVDAAYSIAIDAHSNVYTTGFFDGAADFDPGSGTFTMSCYGGNPGASTGGNCFLSKLDSSGNFAWAKQLGGNEYTFGNSLAVDWKNSLYITGSFQGTGDFYPGAGTVNLVCIGLNNAFISKFDSSGNFVFVKQFKGAFSGADADGYSITVDTSGNIYTMGGFQGMVDLDPSLSNNYNMTSSLGGSNFDSYICKLNASGNFLWAKQLPINPIAEGQSLALDAAGNVYAASSFYSTVDFDPGTGISNLTANGNDGCIYMLDGSGNFVWAKQIGGSLDEALSSVAIDKNGNVYMTGYFQDSTIMCDNDTLTNTTAASNDLFIAKLYSTTVGINEIPENGNAFNVYPNPSYSLATIYFSLSGTENVSIRIFDIAGRLVKVLSEKSLEKGSHQIEWNVKETNAGIYFLKLETGTISETKILSVVK